jgi:hypothetical protein
VQREFTCTPFHFIEKGGFRYNGLKNAMISKTENKQRGGYLFALHIRYKWTNQKHNGHQVGNIIQFPAV